MVNTDGELGITPNEILFTIEYSGTSDLQISSIALSNGDTTDFELVDSTLHLISPSHSTTFSICFDPLTEGIKSATITIENEDSDASFYTFTLSGTGYLAPEINHKQDFKLLLEGTGSSDFGNIVVDGVEGISYNEVQFTIENTGLGDLNISDISFVGGTSSYFELIDASTSTLILLM